MAQRTRMALVAAKIESTYGADPTPTTSADTTIAHDLEVSPEHDMVERPDHSFGLSRLKELTGKRRIKISFTTELRGQGAAGTAPEGIGALFQACAMSETVSASTSVTYAPASSSLKSVTLYVWLEGVQFQIQGAVGTFELMLVAGEVPKIKWSLSGLYETPTDVTFPTSWGVDATVPVTCKNLTTTFDSYAAVIREITLKMNNKITERADLSATHGIRGFEVTDRNPEGEIIVEATVLATKNWYTKLEANTANVLSCAVGATAGNICTITASQCIMRNLPYADDDGILTHPIPFQLSRSTQNDELSIVFT